MTAGFLTTHVLDTARGCPAEGIEIALFAGDIADDARPIARVMTNADGRTDGPILSENDFETGVYTLVFNVGAYLKRTGQVTDETVFLDRIPIVFAMTELSHYHVPLLLSPYGYSTYRGS